MFIQTVCLFVTYSCNGCNFEKKTSFQLARYMLTFRNAGITKNLKPLCMAIINSYEKKTLFIILAMISISKLKNSAYNLIGLEDSCICDHCLTEFFCQLRLLKNHFL